jgi:hypothetical protein
MRTHVEFLSNDFPPEDGEEERIYPGRYGKRLADFLAAELPSQGFSVRCVSPEDWGWVVEIENDAFPLWIGCGNYEAFENGFLCFIEPSKPFLRKWFSKIDTKSTVERLASAVDTLLQDHGNVSQLRWWSERKART